MGYGAVVVLWLLTVVLLPVSILYLAGRLLVVLAVLGFRTWRARR